MHRLWKLLRKSALRIQHLHSGHPWGAGWDIDEQVVLCQCGAKRPLKPWLEMHYPRNKD